VKDLVYGNQKNNLLTELTNFREGYSEMNRNLKLKRFTERFMYSYMLWSQVFGCTIGTERWLFVLKVNF